MKRNLKIVLRTLIFIAIVIWAISRMSFSSTVNQTIEANVYVDGKPMETTTVEMNGKRSNYLFKDEQMFIGSFCIQYYERTCREDMQAVIDWNKYSDTQRILYNQNATFPSLELHNNLCINETMDEFALGFKDGVVIATSKGIYQRYVEN